MSELVAEFGPFKVFEADDHNNDYVLTDGIESVYLGFKEEEAADIEEVMARVIDHSNE